MSRFDRYLLSQLMVLFGFFALILVSVYWINQAVRLFDKLVGDGQSAFVFLEFSALTLPNVIRLVLPMSVFAAAVYVTNRLSTESELVVMQATGFSPWRLARPVLYFGLIIALLMSVLTHVLVPRSLGQLQLREAEVAQNITAKLLTEGTFLHPDSGVTFYIREITPEGELRDVFLSDRRDPAQIRTHTANRAYLVNETERVTLFMVDGLTQSYDTATGRLFTTHFVDFAHDITNLLGTGQGQGLEVRHVPTAELAPRLAEIATLTGQPLGRVAEELHNRFNQALLCVVAALIGFSTLLLGGFSRFGVWWQIVGALLLLVLVKAVEGVVTDPIRGDAALWPLAYAPSGLGLAMACGILWWVGRPRRAPRATEVRA